MPVEQTTPEQVASERAAKPLILITGAAGLIGSQIARALSGRFHVVGMDVAPGGEDSPCADWIRCDLTEDDSVAAAMADLRASHGDHLASVIHLAAYYDFAGEPSPLYDELTVQGTARLLEQLQPLDVEQFIFSSTLLVMEPADEGDALDADSPMRAEWDYPRSKVEAEAVIRNHRGKIPALILRIAGVYDEMGHSVPIAQQIARIHQQSMESYVFPGDKTHGQAFVHLDDLVRCFEQAVARRRDLADWEVLLIGEDDVMSYEELQDRIGDLLYGHQWPTLRIPKPIAKAGAWVQDKLAGEDSKPFIKPWMIELADQHYPVDICQAREKLGWEPQHTLRETLPAMIENLRRDPLGWYQANKLPVPDDLAQAAQSRT